MTKIEALAKYLKVNPTDLFEEESFRFSIGREEYLVLTDREADEMASECIRRDLWAFNPQFIAAHTKKNLTQNHIEALSEMQKKLCEDAQDIIEGLIEDLDFFIEDAIAADGRGHFLSPYDGEENQSGPFFIYRTN